MKLISLLSGGIDSPVASYEMIRKGHSIVFIHFYNNTTNKDKVKDKIKDLIEVLSKYQQTTKLYMVPFKGIQKEIIKIVPAKYRMIVYRRMMLKIGEKIMKIEKADGFVTGDNLGQVASQTLDNMTVIFKATKKTISTPLIGEDKVDIMKKAREIKTYGISIRPYDDCCTFLNAKHPETKAKIKEIEAMEENLKLSKAITNALKESEILQIINKNYDKI